MNGCVKDLYVGFLVIPPFEIAGQSVDYCCVLSTDFHFLLSLLKGFFVSVQRTAPVHVEAFFI